MDESYATNEIRFTANLAVIRKEVSRSHDDFITEHFHKYSEPDLPPVWKTLEVISIPIFRMLQPNTLWQESLVWTITNFWEAGWNVLQCFVIVVPIIQGCQIGSFLSSLWCLCVCQTHGLRISRSVNKHFIRNSAMWCIGLTPFLWATLLLQISSSFYRNTHQ